MEEDGWIPSAGVENEFDINKRNCVLCLVVSFLEVFTIRSMRFGAEDGLSDFSTLGSSMVSNVVWFWKWCLSRERVKRMGVRRVN